MPLRAALTAKVGRAFTKAQTRLEGAGTVTLYRPSGNYDEYDEVISLDDSWLFDNSDTANLQLWIGADTTALTNALGNDPDELHATHVRIDAADAWYTIRDGDTKEPNGMRPYWQLFLDETDRPSRFTSMR